MMVPNFKLGIGDPIHRPTDGNVGIKLLDIDCHNCKPFRNITQWKVDDGRYKQF
jgi:hypothetical protein